MFQCIEVGISVLGFIDQENEINIIAHLVVDSDRIFWFFIVSSNNCQLPQIFFQNNLRINDIKTFNVTTTPSRIKFQMSSFTIISHIFMLKFQIHKTISLAATQFDSIRSLCENCVILLCLAIGGKKIEQKPWETIFLLSLLFRPTAQIERKNKCCVSFSYTGSVQSLACINFIYENRNKKQTQSKKQERRKKIIATTITKRPDAANE